MLLSVCSITGYAFTRLNAEHEHYLTVNANLGYSSLFNSIHKQPSSPGLDTELGVGYRIFHNDFVFATSLGFAYNLYSSQLRMVDTNIDMLDTEEDPFKMHVLVDQGKDLTHAVNLTLPILVGGEWGRLYFLAGPKLSYTIYGVTSAKAMCTTSGIYERYYDDFYNMPNHQFESEQEIRNEGNGKLKWNVNLMVHAEIGWNINTHISNRTYKSEPMKRTWFASLYMDYGLLNINSVSQDANDVFYYRQTDEGVKYFVTPLLLSKKAYDASFNNFNIGIKFTVLFQLPVEPKRYIYDGSKNTHIWKRGGTQAIKN